MRQFPALPLNEWWGVPFNNADSFRLAAQGMTNGDGTPTAAALQQAYPSIPYPGIGKSEHFMSHPPHDVRWFALGVHYISGFVSLCSLSVCSFDPRSEGPFSQGRHHASSGGIAMTAENYLRIGPPHSAPGRPRAPRSVVVFSGPHTLLHLLGRIS